MLLRIILMFVLAMSLHAADEVGAWVVAIGDQHSAYEKFPALLGKIDQLRHDRPGVPMAFLIDGDAFELGNQLSRRSEGEIDFALLAALVRRGPTVFNLGNHDPDLFSAQTIVERIGALGVKVIGANTRDRATAQPFAPASATIALGPHELTIVGLGTDALATFRVAIRPQLDLADPVVWAREHLAAALAGAALPVVMSHAGLRADREILPLVPDGTLFAGAHDHLRLVHRIGQTTYFHSGSWLDCVSIASLRRVGDKVRWRVRQVSLEADGPVDAAMATRVQEEWARHFTPAEQAPYGRTERAMTSGEAALFAVEAARRAAGADVAIIGATTFGAGLPAGDFTRYQFDNFVRFDGALAVGEVDGARLKQILARTNQGPETPFADRVGENLVASGLRPDAIDAAKQYRLATSDWIAKNPAKYLGEGAPQLADVPTLKLKAAVAKALGAAPGQEPAAKR